MNRATTTSSAAPNSRRGIALPVVFGVALCLAVWVGSLSWTMSNSRHRFQRVVKARRAYFMARSALQHLFLKMKTFQRQQPDVMMALERATPEEWGTLSRAFTEDVVLPAALIGSYSASYGVKAFEITGRDIEKSQLVIEIQAEGTVDDMTETISRVNRVSR